MARVKCYTNRYINFLIRCYSYPLFLTFFFLPPISHLRFNTKPIKKKIDLSCFPTRYSNREFLRKIGNLRIFLSISTMFPQFGHKRTQVLFSRVFHATGQEKPTTSPLILNWYRRWVITVWVKLFNFRVQWNLHHPDTYYLNGFPIPMFHYL